MASKVSVGKTAPVPLGQQPAANSLPVVFAEDQPPVPVEEQNKIQSEVALSLLGIPRAEVALGIFADVNTYDINPSEWAQSPANNSPSDSGGIKYGVEHVPKEAGARLVAPDVSTAILTSKRFFRYQPGRVSSSTMGVKMNTTVDPETLPSSQQAKMKGAPSIKKWGIFDKFDGYYFEIANAGKGNDFRCVRRTQAIVLKEPAGYSGSLSWFYNSDSAEFNTSTNFGIAGEDPVIIRDGLVYTAAAIYDPSLVYSPGDVVKIDSSPAGSTPEDALKNFKSNSGYAVRLATFDGINWSEVMTDRKHQFPFDQSKTIILGEDDEETSLDTGYIRLDAHCNFYKTISNLNRKGSYGDFPAARSNLVVGQWGIAGSSISSYNQTIINNTWDTDPSNLNREKKVWHLLVNTQNEDAQYRITEAQHNASGIPAAAKVRNITNGNVTLKEWFNICVPEPYRMIYEWRPVRAMFSGDKLNGVTSGPEAVVRWSDINTAANDTTAGSGASGAVNHPGQKILTPDNEELVAPSEYKIDFTKVTMWKIEFSWYGAVGAIFLCYVPIGNNDARWVRVHHIRVSNQHSVPSLGNPTLPITYLVHGGLGSGLDPEKSGTDIGNTLVKYGASYYIDGGDKGTVRLLSKASDFQRQVPKGFYDFGANLWTKTSSSKLTYTLSNHPTLPGSVAVGLMGAHIEGDSTARVKWVTQSGTNITLHFSNASLPAAVTSGVRLVVPRLQPSLMTMRAKDFIYNRDGQAVRNRLQMYPIKYGAGVTGGSAGEVMTVRAVKNPLVIVTNSNVGVGTTVPYTGASIIRDPDNINNRYVNTKNSTLRVEVGFATAPNIPDGTYRYGYFMGTKDESVATGGWDNGTTDPSAYEPILGKLYMVGTKYFFEKYNSYAENIYIVGFFLPERHLVLNSSGVLSEMVLNQYTSDGATKSANNTYIGVLGSTDSSDQTKWDRLQFETLLPGSNVNSITTATTPKLTTWEDMTRLSGVRISQDLELTPVADTGTEILSYYVNSGGYQFDLKDYFAYNKEYLSFPLTDEVDIINIQGHYDISDEATGSTAPTDNPFKVNSSLTWEEQ